MLKNLDEKLKELNAFSKDNGNYINSKKMIDIAKNFLYYVGEKISLVPSIYSTYHNTIRFCWTHLNGDYLWVELWDNGDCKLTISYVSNHKIEKLLYDYTAILVEIKEFEKG